MFIYVIGENNLTWENWEGTVGERHREKLLAEECIWTEAIIWAKSQWEFFVQRLMTFI